MISWLVSPVDHNHEFPLLAVSVTDPPSQNVVGPPGVMVATGDGSTVTVAEAVPVHAPLFTVTE